MCGIAAVILGRAERSEADLETIWRRFTELLVLTQSRGTDAAGVAIIGPSTAATAAPLLKTQELSQWCSAEPGGARLWVLKAPVAASRLVERPVYSQMQRLTGQATVILGHARQLTKGPASAPINNHPILAGPTLGQEPMVVGVHNGRVLNDDELALKYGLERRGEVDSEVLFQLIALAHDSTEDSREALRQTFEELRGPTACLWVYLPRPHLCYLTRMGSPLSSFYDERLDALFVASVQAHLEHTVASDEDRADVFTDDRVYRLDTSAQRLGWPWDYSQATSYYSRIEALTFDDLRAIAQAREQWTVEES